MLVLIAVMFVYQFPLFKLCILRPISSVANTAAKPRNWATFNPAAAGKKLAPRFANPM